MCLALQQGSCYTLLLPEKMKICEKKKIIFNIKIKIEIKVKNVKNNKVRNVIKEGWSTVIESAERIELMFL